MAEISESTKKAIALTTKGATARSFNAGEHDAIFKALECIDNGIHELGPVPIACKKGCSFCCHKAVRVSEPELRFLVGKLSEEEKTRVAQHKESYCPMLVGGECSQYAYRPAACRTMNSLDAEACHKSLEGKATESSIPHFQPISALLPIFTTASQQGHLSASRPFRTYALSAGLVELCRDNCLTQASQFREVESELTYWSDRASKPPEWSLLLAKVTDRINDEGPQNFLHGLPDGIRHLHAMRSAFAFDSEEQIDRERQRILAAIEEALETKFDADLVAQELTQDMFGAGWNYHGRSDLEIRPRYGQFLTEKIVRAIAPQLLEPMPSRKSGKIRVGYVSQRFQTSNATQWAWSWITSHPRDEIEVFVLDLGSQQDATTTNWKRLADRFIRYEEFILTSAQRIRDLDLDVLIFPDVGLDGSSDLLGCCRLARRQVAAWGGPSSSGMPQMDFFVGGELMLDPDQDAEFSEQLVRLPGIGFGYPERFVSAPTPNPGSVSRRPFLYCCQEPQKLHPKHDELLSQLTNTVDTPILFVTGRPQLTERIAQRLKRQNVRAEWTHGVPFPKFSRILRDADLIIDTPFYNGGITSLWALHQRTPILTLPGPRFRDRFSKAFLTAVGMEKWVPKTPKEYLQMAENWRAMAADMQSADLSPLWECTKATEALNRWILE